MRLSAWRLGALPSLLALAAAIALGAPRAVSAQSAPTGGLRPVREPLEARLYPPDAGTLRFALAESAYVAVFELAPGRGVRLVYPVDDAMPERRLAPGWHTPTPPAADPLATEFASRLDAPADGTRFLYLVASRHPLGLPPGRRSPASFASAMGLLAFRSSNAETQAGALTSRAITLGRAGDWIDTPLVAATPGVVDPLARAGDPTVRCPDGRVYTVTNDGSGRPFECPR